MEKRLAVVSIIIEGRASADAVNVVLAEFGDNIIGRMGLPYKERHISIITVVVEAEQPVINSIAGKLGMIEGVSAKALMR